MLTLDQPVLYISKDWNSYFEDLSYSDYLGPFHLYNSFVASPEEEQIVVVFLRKRAKPAVKFTFPGEALPPIFLILQQDKNNRGSKFTIKSIKNYWSAFHPSWNNKGQKSTTKVNTN